jgi:hypothetical protein
MPDVQQIFVTNRNPSPDGLDPGQVSEGFFVLEDGMLTKTDASIPITDGGGNGWQAKVEPGTERRIAGRLVRAVRARLGLDRDDGFSRSIRYRRRGQSPRAD